LWRRSGLVRSGDRLGCRVAYVYLPTPQHTRPRNVQAAGCAVDGDASCSLRGGAPALFLGVALCIACCSGGSIGFHMPVPYSLAALRIVLSVACTLLLFSTSTVDKRPAGSLIDLALLLPRRNGTSLPPSMACRLNGPSPFSISGHIYLSTRTRYGYLLHCQTYHISITCSGRILCLF